MTPIQPELEERVRLLSVDYRNKLVEVFSYDWGRKWGNTLKARQVNIKSNKSKAAIKAVKERLFTVTGKEELPENAVKVVNTDDKSDVITIEANVPTNKVNEFGITIPARFIFEYKPTPLDCVVTIDGKILLDGESLV